MINIGTMWYYKKKDILKRMWKDEKDVRALDRAIRKWRVIEYKNEWITKRITSGDYEMDEVVTLNGRIKELEAKLKDTKVDSEAAVNAEYYEKLYNEEVAKWQEIIRNMYRYVTKNLHLRVEWEQFRDFAINWEEDSNY